MLLGWLLVASVDAATPEETWGIAWDRRGTGWEPAWLSGVLSLHAPASDAPSAIGFAGTGESFAVELHSASPDDLRFSVVAPGRPGGAFRGFVDGEVLRGWMRWDRLPWTPVQGWRVDALRTDQSARGLPTATPEEVGLDAAAVDAFVREALLAHASGLALACGGRLVVARSVDDRRASIQSITKVVAAMAVPFLVDEQKITLDTPLGEVLTEWAGHPGTPTLRHVLTHTTGLANDPDPRKVVNVSPDRTKLVLQAAQVSPAGTVFSYNNTAMGLLPVVVQRLAGVPIDQYLHTKVFDALGFSPDWGRDQAGTPSAYGGMWMNAAELVVVGQLYLDGGKRGTRQVLPLGWAEKQLTGGAPAVVERPSMGLSWMQLAPGVWGHTGSGGQALVLFPAEGCVASRTHEVGEDEALGHETWDLIAAARAVVAGRKR